MILLASLQKLNLDYYHKKVMIEWLQKSWSASNNDEAVKVASDLINLPDMDVVRENAGKITANVEAPKFIKT